MAARHLCRLLAAAFGAASFGAACDQAEPAPAGSNAVAHPPAATSPEVLRPAASAAPERCLVPLAPEPPHATKASECPADPKGPLAMPRGFVTFTDAPGQPRVEVEIADSPATRERGLMYVTDMPEDRGMIFSWNFEAPRSFWMHDTCIPLDMLFITADGVIAGILEQVPVLSDAPRSVRCPAAHVLEVNAGWTRSHGVVPGQRVHIEH
jgi:uncharacterized membrane protein (UPF0127 family)